MTAWDDDVAEALRCALLGTSQNWPLTARTLAAEISELRAKLIEKLTEDFPRCPRCPRCGRLADSVETRIDGPTRYRHGQVEHLDLTTDLKVAPHGG